MFFGLDQQSSNFPNDDECHLQRHIDKGRDYLLDDILIFAAG